MIPSDIPQHGPISLNITVDNPSSIDLRVEINKNRIGEVEAGQNITVDVPIQGGTYVIEMRDTFLDNAASRTTRTFQTLEALSELENHVLKVIVQIPTREIIIQNGTNKVLTVRVGAYEVSGIIPVRPS